MEIELGGQGVVKESKGLHKESCGYNDFWRSMKGYRMRSRSSRTHNQLSGSGEKTGTMTEML